MRRRRSAPWQRSRWIRRVLRRRSRAARNPAGIRPLPSDSSGEDGMETRIDEVADGIFRLSSWVPKVTAEGFTFNQFLIRAEQPMLFHCGHRAMFPQI